MICERICQIRWNTWFRRAGPAEGNRIVTAHGLAPDGGIWAFEAVPGGTSPVAEAPDAYYVFRLDSLQAGGVPPFEDIEPVVRQAAVRAKKWEAARQIAGTIEPSECGA